jgi:pimeloyl-ACP methyl ester carboxylesterase
MKKKIPLRLKIKALRFLILTLAKKQFPIEFEEIPLQLAYDYSLKRVKSNKQDILLIFHSLNGMGNQDPRVHQLAATATRIGFNVYLPNLTDTASNIIRPDSVDRMRYFLKECYHHFKKPFSILAPSYDGSTCLEALSHDEIKPMVKSMCCIGSSHALHEMLDDALHRNPCEPYNLLVVLKTLLHETGQLTPNLVNILASQFAIEHGMQFNINTKELNLTPEEQHWYNNLSNQQLIRETCYREGFDQYQWDLPDRLHLITTPIAILHGLNDSTVPVSSAHELDRGLTSAPHKLAVTHLLSHGDIQTNRLLFRDLTNVINTCAFFFAHAFKK